MTTIVDVVEGWTGALPFTLKADEVPVDLTGMTVYIVLRDNRGATVKDSTAGITVTGSTAGQLEYAPSSSDFAAARTPYRVRFRVKDALTKVVYFPNEDEDLVSVNPI